MSDHNHDKHRDATSDERVQQQRQPAPEPSLAEQVVAQFRMQNPRAWFEASPLERFQARQAAFDQQRQLVLQMSRHTLGLGPATQQVKQIAGAGLQGASTGMPFQQQIQSSFGKHDVSSVRSTVGGPAEQANTQLGSLAYASGDAIAFRQQPDLFTAAHEAAHIVQQRAGVNLKSGIGEVGDSYEQHADAVASLVVQGKSAESLLDEKAPPTSTKVGADQGLVQQKKGTENECAPNSCEPPKRGKKHTKKDLKFKHAPTKYDAKDDQECPALDFNSPPIVAEQQWYTDSFAQLEPKYTSVRAKKSQYVEAYRKWDARGRMPISPQGLTKQVGGKKQVRKIVGDEKVGDRLTHTSNLRKVRLKKALEKLNQCKKDLGTALRNLETQNFSMLISSLEQGLATETADHAAKKEKIALAKKYAQGVLKLGFSILSAMSDPTKLGAVIENSFQLGVEAISDVANTVADKQFESTVKGLKEANKATKVKIESNGYLTALDAVGKAASNVRIAKLELSELLNDIRGGFKAAGKRTKTLIPGEKGRVGNNMISSIPFVIELGNYSKMVYAEANALFSSDLPNRARSEEKKLGRGPIEPPRNSDGPTNSPKQDGSNGPESDNGRLENRTVALTDTITPAVSVARQERELMKVRTKEFAKLAQDANRTQQTLLPDDPNMEG